MARPSVSIRLGVEGKEQVKNDFAEVGRAGSDAAKRWGAEFDRQSALAQKATERAAAAAQRVAAATGAEPADVAERQRQEALGARMTREYEAQLSGQRQAALQLLTAYDPLYAAEQRLAQVRAVLSSEGARLTLTEEQRVLIEQRLREAIDQSTLAQTRHNAGAGLLRAGYQQLGFQVQDFFTQLSGGQRIATVLAQQLPQAAFAVGMIGDAAEASGTKLTGMAGIATRFAGFMTTAWGAAITGGILLLTQFIPKMLDFGDATDEAARAERDAAGAADAFASAQSTLGRIMDLNTGRLTSHNAVLRETIRLEATQRLAAAQEQQYASERTLRDLPTQIGARALLSGPAYSRAYLSHLFRGEAYASNPALGQLRDQFLADQQRERPTMTVTDVRRQLERFQRDGSGLAGSSIDTIMGQFLAYGRARDAVRAQQGIIDAVDGRGLIPELRRPGSGGGGKRSGANDNDDLARAREVVVALQQENAARAAVNAAIESGSASIHQMNDLLGDEAKLRPLLAMRARAQGADQQRLTGFIDACREALRKSHEEEAHGQALQAIQTTRERIEDARHMLQFIGTDAERALEAARTAAEAYADARGFGQDDRRTYVQSRVELARTDIDSGNADQVRRLNDQHRDAIQLLQFELSLGGRQNAQTESLIHQEQVRIEMTRKLGAGHEAIVAQLVKQAAAEDRARQQVEQLRDAWREVQQVGGNVIDDVLNIDNWDDWGAAGKRILHELLQEMLTLAAANPLKNLLFGSHLPTLGGIGALFGLGGGKGGGVLGALFGGGGSKGGGAVGDFLNLATGLKGFFASGTEYSPGGLALLGENGPELAALPRGSKVWNAADTGRMLAGGSGGGPGLTIVNHNDFRGADASAVAAVEARQRRFEEELPSRVVTAWSEAVKRNVIR